MQPHHRRARAGRDDHGVGVGQGAERRRATRRASATNPLFHAGCPQQVAPEGRRTRRRPRPAPPPRRAPAAGCSASPRQVGKRPTIAPSSYGHDRARHLRGALVSARTRSWTDVSAIVRPRDRVALVGRNGAGKTTLLRILAGELDARRGARSRCRRARASPCTTSGRRSRRPTTLGEYVGAGAGDGRAARGRAARARGADGRGETDRRGDAPLRRRPARVRARRRLRAGGRGSRRSRAASGSRRPTSTGRCAPSRAAS